MAVRIVSESFVGVVLMPNEPVSLSHDANPNIETNKMKKEKKKFLIFIILSYKLYGRGMPRLFNLYSSV